jgi:putative membrane protein insertion efficiency factor
MTEPAIALVERADAATESPSAGPVLADLASIVLFVALGSVVASAFEPILAYQGLGFVGRSYAIDVALAASALVAFFAAGKERGLARVASPALSLAFAAFAAVVTTVFAFHARGEWPFGPLAPSPALVVARALVVLLGAPLVRVGSRFDRLEEGWRAAARLRPAEATPPLAHAIARFRLPRVLYVLLLPLAPVGLVLALLGLVAIRLYQLTLSRLMPPVCRFEPSCSRYAFDALKVHGAVKGTVLTTFRVARCQPFCADGHDPVPAREDGLR